MRAVDALRVLLALILLALVPGEARAQEPGTVELPGPPGSDRSVRALWTDGDELLIAGGRRSLYVIEPDAPALREEVDVEVFVDADGTRAIGGVLAVFAAADGRIIRWSPDSIEADQIPLLEGDEIVAVVVDASGYIYGIGRERALYEYGAVRWRVFPYPARMRPLAAAASPGGQVYIVGRDGLLVRFRDGDWDRPLIPGLSPESIRAPWYDAWYSAVTETLWVRAGRDRLIELEVGEQSEITQSEREAAERETPLLRGRSQDERSEDSEDPEDSEDSEDGKPPPREGPTISLHVTGSIPTREHPIPLGPPAEGEAPPGFTAIAGTSAASGDRILTAAGGKLWLYQRERWVSVEEDTGLVHDLAFDEGADMALVASQSGLSRVQLRGPGEEAAADPLAESDRKLLDRLTRREQWRQQNAKLPQIFWMPTVRIDNGVVFPLEASPVAGYSLEVGAGAMLAPIDKERGPTLWVWPELAYRFETHPTRGGHLFDAGVGVGWGNHLVAAFYRPRLVVGGIDQGVESGVGVYGLRHGIAVEALWGVLGIEFSHQFLGSNQGALTDLRLGLSVNLAPIIWGAILWATIPTNDR